jgi:putative ubiquitin-RnfH superfamily antitoxin RatB of RatAB toxin-antitoxin module
MKISVVYALPGELLRCELELAPGARVGDAIEQSGLTGRFPELAQAAVGIYGRVVDRNAVLAEGDRVEFYRPLNLEPKAARRARLARRRG